MEGGITMKITDKGKIISLKNQGKSYQEISLLLNIPRSTISSFINSLKEINTCKECGKKIDIIKGHRKREFCSNSCRYKYWSKSNLNQKKAVCLCCNPKLP